MTYVALILLGVVVMVVALVGRENAVVNRTDAGMIEHHSKKTPDPVTTDSLETFSFAGKSISHKLHASFQRVAISLQPQVAACLRKSPNYPDKTLVYLETDPAGRLTGLKVQSAPPAAARCLSGVFSMGQFTRGSSGIAELQMSRGRARRPGEYY